VCRHYWEFYDHQEEEESKDNNPVIIELLEDGQLSDGSKKQDEQKEEKKEDSILHPYKFYSLNQVFEEKGRKEFLTSSYIFHLFF